MNKIKKGLYGEYAVILKLLEKGFEVYPSLIDDRGVDLVVRNPNGFYLEIQVKSVWSEKHPQWFQVQTRTDTDLSRDNFFLICLDQQQSTWIFPSNVFFNSRYVQKSKSRKGIFTFDLNLQSKPRGNKATRSELLKKYKENWNILLNHK